MPLTSPCSGADCPMGCDGLSRVSCQDRGRGRQAQNGDPPTQGRCHESGRHFPSWPQTPQHSASSSHSRGAGDRRTTEAHSRCRAKIYSQARRGGGAAPDSAAQSPRPFCPFSSRPSVHPHWTGPLETPPLVLPGAPELLGGLRAAYPLIQLQWSSQTGPPDTGLHSAQPPWGLLHTGIPDPYSAPAILNPLHSTVFAARGCLLRFDDAPWPSSLTAAPDTPFTFQGPPHITSSRKSSTIAPTGGNLLSCAPLRLSAQLSTDDMPVLGIQAAFSLTSWSLHSMCGQ